MIAVPEAEPLVARWRARYDPSAERGLPAHITILYPFVSSDHLGDEIVGDLTALFGSVRSFDFSLTGVRRFPEVSYLAPEPAEPFVGLVDLVTKRYPEFLPYGGVFEHVVPHLTVAVTRDERVLTEIASALSPGLPVVSRASSVLLMKEDAHGRWSVRRAFDLATDST